MVRPSDGLMDDFGDPQRSPRAVWLQRAAHLVPLALVAYLAFAVLRWIGVIEIFGWQRLLVQLPVLVVLVIGMFHTETARLCLLCMKGTPLNPSKIARRDVDLLLQLFHRLMDGKWWYLKWYVALWVGEIIASLIFRTDTIESPWLTVPTTLFFLATMWSFWKHHRYRPWCPYCRKWDDGGDREPSPDPNTSGTKTAA